LPGQDDACQRHDEEEEHLTTYPAVSARGIDLDIPRVGEQGRPIAIDVLLQSSHHPLCYATHASTALNSAEPHLLRLLKPHPSLAQKEEEKNISLARAFIPSPPNEHLNAKLWLIFLLLEPYSTGDEGVACRVGVRGGDHLPLAGGASEAGKFGAWHVDGRR
jgi:hypothetical protein